MNFVYSLLEGVLLRRFEVAEALDAGRRDRPELLGDLLQEMLVVGDGEDTARVVVLLKGVNEGLNGVEIQVIRRLINMKKTMKKQIAVNSIMQHYRGHHPPWMLSRLRAPHKNKKQRDGKSLTLVITCRQAAIA